MPISLSTMQPPRDVTVRLGGQKREMDEAQESLRFALLLAVFLVYVVMASQFVINPIRPLTERIRSSPSRTSE